MAAAGAAVLLRSNPGYELVLADRLDRRQRERLLGGAVAEGLYGVLLPREGEPLEARAVSPDTALLFLTLTVPGPLPDYLGAMDPDDVSRLVADGVLEVERDGAFVTGPDALGAVAARREVDELTEAALRYGQGLRHLDEHELARRLYDYNRRPLTPRMRARFPDAGALAEHLGLEAGGPVAQGLGTRWALVPTPAGASVHWWQWAVADRAPRTHGVKLYVCPVAEEMVEAVRAVTGVVARARDVTGFKVAAGVEGMCRPDKLVVYLRHEDALREVAGEIEDRVSGTTPQGVPFTAPVTPDRLLSWGADPPSRLALPDRDRTSWRFWVCRRLAAYLKAGGHSPDSWRFALERLRLSGVDSDGWVPAERMWRRSAGTE